MSRTRGELTAVVAARAPGPAPAGPPSEPNATALPERPRRLRGLEVDESTDGRWVVYDAAASRYCRLGPDAIAVFNLLDGSRTLAQVSECLGERYPLPVVRDVALDLLRHGLLEGPRLDRARPRRKRLTVRGAACVQLSLVDSSRLAGCLRPVGLLFVAPGAGAAAWTLGLLAAVVWIYDSRLATQLLGGPLPLSVLLWSYVGILTVSSLHELAHAAALTAYGGRPMRMGLMLFYLSPSLFCDVSDAWRLPLRRQRRTVALAGVRANMALAGILAVAAALAPRGTGSAALMLTSLLSAGVGLFNLIPLVKLDGYLALMTQLDVPFLRERAMKEAGDWVLHALFGVHRAAPGAVGRWWAVPYGLGCIAFPVVLVAAALQRYLPGLLAFGRPGAVLWLGVLALAVAVLARRIVRFLADASRRAGTARRRFVITLLAGAGCLAAAGAGIQVPRTMAAGYETRPDGLWLHVPASGDAASVPPGARLDLSTPGWIWRRHVGTAVVAGPGQRELVSLESVTPLVDTGLRAPANTYRTGNDRLEGGAPPRGYAMVKLGSAPLARALWDGWVAPPLRAVTLADSVS